MDYIFVVETSIRSIFEINLLNRKEKKGIQLLLILLP